MLDQKFVVVGTLIGAAGALAYLVDTLRGRVRPNRVSFLMWSIAPLIAFAAQLQQGVGLESLMTFSVGFLPFLTFAASFVNRNAAWKSTRFDFACGALSAAGLVLWLVTKVGNIAIMFSIAADGLAAVPTIVKAYRYPETELAWPWMATCIGVALTLATLERWTFANSGFILYIFAVDLAIFALVVLKPGKRRLGTAGSAGSAGSSRRP